MNAPPRRFVPEAGPLLDVPIPAVFKPLASAPPTRPAAMAPTGIEAAVCHDIARRQQLGVAKYGTTVQANPLPLRAWLQHAYEELLDGAVYLRRAIADIDAAGTGGDPRS